MSNVVKLNRPVFTARSIARRASVSPAQEAAPTSIEEAALFEQMAAPAVNEETAGSYAKGYADGAREAETRLRPELDDRLRAERERVEQMVASLRTQWNEWLGNAEVLAVRFSLAVAERIVKREVALQEDMVLRQIKDGVRHIVGVATIKIRINPADESLVRSHRSGMIAESEALREILIESDESIERGSCMIESDAGTVDARVATQLKKIESIILDGFADRGEKGPSHVA